MTAKQTNNSLFLFAVAFALGCGIGTYAEAVCGISYWLVPIAVVLCILDVAFLVFVKLSHGSYRMIGIVSSLIVPVVFGVACYDIRNPSKWGNNYIYKISDNAETLFVADIKGEPQRTSKRLKATADVVAVQSGDSLLSTVGKAVLYFDTLDTWAKPGVRIVAQGEFKPLPYSIGAEHFRYRRYMQRKGIMSQCFVKSAEQIEPRIPSAFCVYRWRNRLSETLNASNLSDEKLGIVRALVLGDREAPQEITKEEFRAAGLSHLLCVSGLHVGIVAVLVLLLFRPLGARRHVRIVRGMAELAAVWLFVTMTGMAPSTLRAGTMFSFLIVGGLVASRPVSLNALGLSAITLLVIRPTMIADIGFQLSYVAVAGILVFYKPVRNLLPIGGKRRETDMIDYDEAVESCKTRTVRSFVAVVRHIITSLVTLAWESLVLCTVAQVCVMPLILYYFHQLTPWFMIANVLIVPFAGLLLGSIMLMLAVSGWPLAWQTVQCVVDWELGVICEITHRVAALPMAIIDNVPFSLPMLVVSDLLLVVSAIAMHRHAKA